MAELKRSSEAVRACLVYSEEKNPGPTIGKFREYINPPLDCSRVHFGKYFDEHIPQARNMTHGLLSDKSNTAGSVVNPEPKTTLQEKQNELKCRMYESSRKKPLGSVPDNELPEFIKNSEFSFGIKSEKGEGASVLVQPPVSYPEIEQNEDRFHDLYRFSHASYYPGEQLHRSYVNPVDPQVRYGVTTNADLSGKNVNNAFQWVYESQLRHGHHISLKRHDDFLEKTHHRIGKSQQPNHYEEQMGQDYRFGIKTTSERQGVKQAIHDYQAEPDYRRFSLEKVRSIVHCLRQKLKRENLTGHHLNELRHAFKQADKDGSGLIDFETTRQLTSKFFSYVLSDDALKMLFDFLSQPNNGKLINYNSYCDVFDPNSEVVQPDFNPPETTLVGDKEGTGYLSRTCAVDTKPTSLDIGKTADIKTTEYRSFGVPSVRYDLSCPRIRTVHDRTDYGDSSSASALLSPTFFTQRGVPPQVMFQPRSKPEVREFFSNIGVQMDNDTFDRLWDLAKARSSEGVVSWEGFRGALETVEQQKLVAQMSDFSLQASTSAQSTTEATAKQNPVPAH